MKQQKFEATLKKSVAMFNMLTGRDLTEREGSAFIQIFDLVDEYTGTGGDAVQTFDVLSQAQPAKPGMRETPAAKELQALDIPTLAHREVYAAVADCGCPEGRCTCTNEMLANVPSRAAKVIVESTPTSISPWLDRGPKGLQRTDPAKQAEIDAAWQTRDREQAQESERIEESIRTSAASEKASRYVNTNGRDKHPVGYDWQVCALCREGSPNNSTVRCYKSKPTPEEFFELYRLYDAHTHWVFINRWNAGAQRWDRYLHEYLQEHEQEIRNLRGTIPPRVVKVSKDPDELRGRDVSEPPMSAPWEEDDKPWRIRYFSDVMGRVIFTYVDKKPTGAEMMHFHHTKCLAVSQAKPKQ